VTLADALRELLNKVGITSDYYQVVRLEHKGWWSSIFSSQAMNLLTGKIKHQISFSPEIDVLLRNQYLYLYCPQ
jgi:hypothetical protein